ncbi:MAG: alanine racemase, partial [Ilumatobacteraceae bacterium]
AEKLRPHVKAFKSTSLAKRLTENGHRGFCCATVREMMGMAAAGLGDDLLLANESLDLTRLTPAIESGAARITVAVDSEETIAAAAKAAVPEVLIDVNVGLPRCGCDPADAGRLADLARSKGVEVRGVMGYEGHLMALEDRARQREAVAASMTRLVAAHADVGGDIISAGGTGTYDLHDSTGVNEIQAGSYALMDSAYAKLGLPFQQALFVVGTVISVRPDHAVADVGLKALGMDHGNPSISGASVWFCSDEHVTFAGKDGAPVVGDRVRVVPAHVDPTMAMHEAAWLVDGDEVLDRWTVDLRGWG